MKQQTLLKIRSSKTEKGAVLAELSLILPFLTFLILAVTDFGMFLQTYFQVCHVAREGLRTAVSVPDLSGAATNYGKYKVTTDTPGVLAFSPLTGLNDAHRFIHQRLEMLFKADNGLEATHSLQLQDNAVEVWTKCIPGANGADKVEIEVAAVYRPITPFNDLLAIVDFSPINFKFSTKSEGAYLFNNCAP